MPDSYDKFAAARPSNTNEASLYVVGSGGGESQIIGTLNICNQDTTARAFSVAIANQAGAADNADWIESDTPIEPNRSMRIPIVAASGRDIRIKASVADKISFVFYGAARS